MRRISNTQIAVPEEQRLKIQPTPGLLKYNGNKLDHVAQPLGMDSAICPMSFEPNIFNIMIFNNGKTKDTCYLTVH